MISRVLLFTSLLVCLPTFSFAIPEKLNKQIDAVFQLTESSLDQARSFITMANNQIDSGDVSLTQKDANKEKKSATKAKNKANKVKKAIRKRLNQLRQNPNFDETTEEIEDLEGILDILEADIDSLNDVVKQIKGFQSQLNFPNKKTQNVIDTANMALSDFGFLEIEVDRIIAEGASCSDRELVEVIEENLKEFQKAIRLARKRLNPLFQNLDKTAEIRAIQRVLKEVKAAKKKCQQALREINKLSDEECNNIEIVKSIAGIDCTFFGQIQASGLGTATFTCAYPENFNSGLLELSIIHPDTNQIVDYGFAAVNFGDSTPRELRIDPCPTSLPVCEEAVDAVRAVQSTSATLIVKGNGETLGTLVFSLGDDA